MLGKTEMRRWRPDFMVREGLRPKNLLCASFRAWFYIYSSARRVKEPARVKKIGRGSIKYPETKAEKGIVTKNFRNSQNLKISILLKIDADWRRP